MRDVGERQRSILALARSSGSVEATDLADKLGVSIETVRRDLRVLEQHGVVRRTHGGAYPVENAGFETRLSERTGARLAEKRRIAQAAIGCLADASSVFIDEGFTPQPGGRGAAGRPAHHRADGVRAARRRDQRAAAPDRDPARRPGATEHPRRRRRLGDGDARPVRRRPGDPRRERHLADARPHDARPGGGRRQDPGDPLLAPPGAGRRALEVRDQRLLPLRRACATSRP
nr:DeoR family transcriptional regulator [Angustibacter aerolatus]